MSTATLVRRAAPLVAAIAMLVLTVAPAAGQAPPVQQCKPQSVLVEVTGFQWVDDLCGALPVKGTLNGTYFTCYVPDSGSPWGVSVFPLGADPDDYYAYFAEWIETPRGRLGLHSTGVGFWSNGLGAGLSKVVPEQSTGEFEGATGFLSLMPEWETFDPVDLVYATRARLNGYVCTR